MHSGAPELARGLQVPQFVTAVAAAAALWLVTFDPGVTAAELTARSIRLHAADRELHTTLWLAEGFDVNVFADGLPHARMLAQSPTGELVVSQHFEGWITKVADRDGDGVADEHVPILTGLNVPHGLAFADDRLVVAESHRVLVLDRWWDGSTAREIIKLPRGGQHLTRTLSVGPDGLLYVSIGSSCDVCIESEPMRAAIWRFGLDGSGGQAVAGGLRNAVGLAWQPDTDRLWVTENERNELGEELPPDELNEIHPGATYGWPFCYGSSVPAPELGDPERCSTSLPPALELPAHSAPLGLAFYSGDRFPADMRGDLFVAFHGSALRERPVGYSLVRIPFRGGTPQAPVEFARGWLVGDDSWGRPVAPFVGRDGALYLTDDKAGAIYRITFRGG
jgi:glucose/arabinose dehydrogenase